MGSPHQDQNSFPDLTPANGLLFRITHVGNLRWLLTHGLHCARAQLRDPAFIEIGSSNLIAKRRDRRVPQHPCGTLSDYVPFYFTPRSPMLFNIKTGWKGLQRRSNADIAILVTAVSHLKRLEVPILFTDRHAYAATARFSNSPDGLSSMVDWAILQNRDFRNTDEYPDKMDRYQAEALVYRHVPVTALRGIGCVSASVQTRIEALVAEMGLSLRVVVRPGWYF